MRVLILLLALLLTPQMGWAAPAHVQSANADNTFDTTCVVSLTGTTAGNLLVLSVGGNFTSAPTSVGSSGGLTYVEATKTLSFQGVSLVVYYVKNIGGGNEAATVNLPSTASANCSLLEYSGLDTTAPLDKFDSAGGTGTTSTDGDVSPSATTTADGELVLSSILETSGVSTTFTAGTTGFTRRQHGQAGGSYRHGVEDLVQTNAGAIQGTWTASGTSNYIASIVTFKVASGSSPDMSHIRKRLVQ